MVKTAVVAKALAGECNAKIARDLGMTRNTVRVILDESQLTEIVNRGKSDITQLIPKSVKAIDGALSKKSPDTFVARWLLEKTGVAVEQKSGTPINLAVQIITNVNMPHA